jgi:hypothetical protein
VVSNGVVHHFGEFPFLALFDFLWAILGFELLSDLVCGLRRNVHFKAVFLVFE